MNLPKKLAFLVFFLSLTTSFLLVKIVRAQIPNPYVPCDEVRPDLLHPFADEFHSLRPYQASPCDEEVHEDAIFCGNNLVVADSITVSRGEAVSCETLPDGDQRCTFIKDRSRKIAIDLSDAELPIMGNTELVVNSQEQPDPEGLDDAEKVNEYVSWYLNGVINRAEYSYLDPEDEEDIRKIVDFSGPLRKLLPNRVQRDIREKVVKEAAETRHDQIVGCVNLIGQITECYPKRIGVHPVRLSDWSKRLPPREENYRTFRDYWIAYKRWRGESCIKLPLLGITVCIDSPLKPNYWGNLFANIPFSSTEDRKGLVETSTFGIQPVQEGVTITNRSFSNQKPAELFFAHMQESAELSEILQQTFVPQGADKVGPVSGVSPGGYCDLVNVRSNAGDDLFAGEISGTLFYTAEFTCDFEVFSSPESTRCSLFDGQCVTDEWSCDFSYPRGMGCPQGFECKVNCSPPPQECTKNANVNLSVISKTPKADEVWSRTVAGPSAIFKRIFPKVGLGGAILGILDIPTATKVIYSGDGLILAGNPGNQRSGESAELYFPHIGGISEYFLKGIQTILRPKGFGEQILSGQAGRGVGGQCEYTDAAIDSAIQRAASKYSVPASLLRAIFEIEGLDYIADPGNYVCMENAAGAAGLMQITRSAYNVVTCENERLDNDLGVCTEGTSKLSRCDGEDGLLSEEEMPLRPIILQRLVVLPLLIGGGTELKMQQMAIGPTKLTRKLRLLLGSTKKRGGASCGRSHPWLTSEEMADVLNAWQVLYKGGGDTSRISPIDTGCWGGNPYSMGELKSIAGYSSVSSVSVIYGNDGSTLSVHFSTNKGGVTIPGSELKKAFNLRAPGYIGIKSSLFNIVKL